MFSGQKAALSLIKLKTEACKNKSEAAEAAPPSGPISQPPKKGTLQGLLCFRGHLGKAAVSAGCSGKCKSSLYHKQVKKSEIKVEVRNKSLVTGCWKSSEGDLWNKFSLALGVPEHKKP